MHLRRDRRKFHRLLPFPLGFYGLANIPTIFQEKIDQTLENKHPAWLDDIIVVTKGSEEEHMRELIDVLTKLENAGYRLSETKSEFFKTEIEWIGHRIDQVGIRPLQDKLLAIKELKQPNNEEELKSFLGAIQYLSKYIDNLSVQTDSLRSLLKKNNNWIWTEEHTLAFENLKQKITEIPCLAHYNSDYPNVINNRRKHQRPRGNSLAGTTERKFKTYRFRESFLIRYRKKICDKRTRTIGSSVGFKTLPSIYLR